MLLKLNSHIPTHSSLDADLEIDSKTHTRVSVRRGHDGTRSIEGRVRPSTISVTQDGRWGLGAGGRGHRSMTPSTVNWFSAVSCVHGDGFHEDDRTSFGGFYFKTIRLHTHTDGGTWCVQGLTRLPARS